MSVSCEKYMHETCNVAIIENYLFDEVNSQLKRENKESN
jgi:hypothetical protein